MKYVVMIFASVVVDDTLTKKTKEVKVKVLETTNRSLAFKNAGELDDAATSSNNNKANILCSCSPNLLFNLSTISGTRVDILDVPRWEARVMMEKRVTRKKLELAK
mgnify:CR=1 FL=1